MEGKYITVDGVNLFYVEKNENAAHSIFFFHGNSSSHRTWQYQFDSEAFADIRLIAFDLPAHGLSDGASAQMGGYTLPNMATVMAKAVQGLSLGKPFILVGVSLGTNIIAEMMSGNLNPEALLLAGPCIMGVDHPMSEFVIPDTKIGLGFVDIHAMEDSIGLYELAVNYLSRETETLIVGDMMTVKDGFRSAIGQSVADGIWSDEVSLIGEKNIPVLIVFGGSDKAIYPDYLDAANLPFWNGKIVKIADAGHWVHQDEPELFARLLFEFAAEIFSIVDAGSRSSPIR